jgi:hypothetical protein
MFWRKKEPQARLKPLDEWRSEFDQVHAVRVVRYIGAAGAMYEIHEMRPSSFVGKPPMWGVRIRGVETYEAAVKAADLLFKTKGEPETVYEIGPQGRGTRP